MYQEHLFGCMVAMTPNPVFLEWRLWVSVGSNSELNTTSPPKWGAQTIKYMDDYGNPNWDITSMTLKSRICGGRVGNWRKQEVTT